MKLIIEDKEYKGFIQYSINLAFNTIAGSFSFDFQRDIYDLFLEYPDCEIREDDDKLILTGTLLAPNLSVTDRPEIIQAIGYSRTGILEDCTIPISSYPLQFDNLSLAQIADKLLDPFGLKWESSGGVDSDMNKSYKKINSGPGTPVKQFLQQLSSQRNIYLSYTPEGKVLFTRFVPDETLPSGYIDENQPGVNNIKLSINSQSLHSSITVIKQASKDNPDGGQATVNNPYVSKFRPKIKILNTGDIFDVEKAARNELSSELSNIKVTFNTTKKYLPGQTVDVTAPKIKLINERLFIESVNIAGNNKNEDNYSVTCTLLNAYADIPVYNIF